MEQEASVFRGKGFAWRQLPVAFFLEAQGNRLDAAEFQVVGCIQAGLGYIAGRGLLLGARISSR
jgi:hypothetical protein